MAAESDTSRSTGFLVCAAAYAAAALAARVVAGASGSAHPVAAAAVADLAATVVVFVGSLGANNSSIYDPYWSVAPPVIGFSWFLGAPGAPPSLRAILCLGALVLWSGRLTLNWARRWRGLGHEDWRYADYRSRRLYWLISLAGFHLMPTVLVFLACVPLYPALTTASRGPSLLDLVAAAVCAASILIEAVADRQLTDFLRSPQQGEIMERGLWSLSRHPNYFGEVSFWWGLWLFSLAASPSWWWTVIGPLAITALFLGISIPMMDRHLRERHPEYVERLRSCSAFLPWFPRGG